MGGIKQVVAVILSGSQITPYPYLASLLALDAHRLTQSIAPIPLQRVVMPLKGTNVGDNAH